MTKELSGAPVTISAMMSERRSYYSSSHIIICDTRLKINSSHTFGGVGVLGSSSASVFSKLFSHSRFFSCNFDFLSYTLFL